jgi:hypothetical protein
LIKGGQKKKDDLAKKLHGIKNRTLPIRKYATMLYNYPDLVSKIEYKLAKSGSKENQEPFSVCRG